MGPGNDLPPVILAICAVVLVAGLFGLLIRKGAEQRRTDAALRAATAAADALRDDVWRLEEAAAARERAEAANEAKSRFLATVSHEIRTPLAGIIGAADLLTPLVAGEASTYVDAIRESGAALASLIDEILDLSRIEAGRLDLADATFDVAPLVEGVVELLAPRAHGAGLAIAAAIATDAPRQLRGDPARVRQILLNLAGNAVKFTTKGGVGLRVHRDGDGTIRFSVADTGPGIAPERHGTIFDEFEQSSSTKGVGTGLGLAISRALAHRMGGALTLDASSPTGSVFSLALPHTAAVSSPGSPAVTGHPNATRVLLIAGAPFEAPYLAERLDAAGAFVRLAAEEDAAMAALAQSPVFDLVIIDCALGSREVCRLADTAREAGVPRTLLLLSPYERRAADPTLWRAVDGWLVKPVRDNSVRRCLADHGSTRHIEAGDESAAPLLRGVDVFLAEDDDVNALIVTRMLQRAGAEVRRVRDGEEACGELVDGSTFDVAILDIRMPSVGGLDVARAIRSAERIAGRRRLPLVALSANAFDDDRLAALGAGFDRFLVKPVSSSLLSATLSECLRPSAASDAA